MNFCHPRAGITGFAALALVTGPGLITLFLFGSYTAALLAMLLSIVAVITWAHREASGKKFDTRG